MFRKMKKLLAVALAGAVSACLLAGCGGDGSGLKFDVPDTEVVKVECGGHNFKVMELKNEDGLMHDASDTSIKGLCVFQDKAYLGREQIKGAMQLTLTKDAVKLENDKLMEKGDCRDLCSDGEGMYFEQDHKIYRYDGKNPESVVFNGEFFDATGVAGKDFFYCCMGSSTNNEEISKAALVDGKLERKDTVVKNWPERQQDGIDVEKGATLAAGDNLYFGGKFAKEKDSKGGAVYRLDETGKVLTTYGGTSDDKAANFIKDGSDYMVFGKTVWVCDGIEMAVFDKEKGDKIGTVQMSDIFTDKSDKPVEPGKIRTRLFGKMRLARISDKQALVLFAEKKKEPVRFFVIEEQ